MATMITSKLTINGAGSDVILDGLDFTADGYVEIRNAASVSVRNCRVYGMNVEGASKNYWLRIYGDILMKLTITGCFFGDNPGTAGSMYNLIEPTAKLKDGSTISGNYFTAGCCTHNCLNIYGADDNSKILVNGNYFETSAGTIRIGVKGEPVCDIYMSNNYIRDKHPGYGESDQGLVTIQPYGKQTPTFANMTIHMNNTHCPSEQIIYGYYGSKDTVLDASTMPVVLVDGVDKTESIAIYH